MKYFGTDGIRGIPNEKLNMNLLTRLGESLYLLENKDVVIGTDTRISKDMLTYAIASACMSKGLNVHFIGVLPTPALIYYSYVKKYTGVMITASHNPYYDNGVKVIKSGFKLSIEDELLLEDYIDNPKDEKTDIGTFINEDAYDTYFAFARKLVVNSNLKIAIDCANGASYKTAPLLFKEVTDNLIVISNTPDGYNINKDCGSTHLDLLKKTVIDNQCNIGFAFDGDADRVLCINSTGKVIDGDKLIYLIGRYLKSKNQLKKDTVVLSMMSNLGIIQDLKRKGISTLETNVGDKYIIQALKEYDLSIGGENSGHIIVPSILHTGDGVINALFIIKILTETNTSIDDWFKDIEMYEDMMVNLKVKDKTKVFNDKELPSLIERIKHELNSDCKIIVRPSGTEDLVRITVMAKEKDMVEKYIDELTTFVANI